MFFTRRPAASDGSGYTAPVLAALIAATTGCTGGGVATESHRLCRAVGICEDLSPAPETSDVLCDNSRASPCTSERLSLVLEQLLARLAAQPGSRVRLWIMPSTSTTGGPLSERISPEPTAITERGRRREQARWIKETKDGLLAAARFPVAPTRRSPIAEALGRIALADGHGHRRFIVVVSDGREQDDLSFECARLPTAREFSAHLTRTNTLPPDRLRGVRVFFVFFRMPPVRECPERVGLTRELRIQRLWRGALAGAGAAGVVFSTELPDLAGTDEAVGAQHPQGEER